MKTIHARFHLSLVLALLSLALVSWPNPSASAEETNAAPTQPLARETYPETDWFSQAKLGAFMHFLPGSPEQFAAVDQFDVEALADQLEKMGARYFVFTLQQNSGYINSPNSRYDHYTGYQPGEKCAKRDLPLELAEALNKKGIKLMLYIPAQVPNRDPKAQAAFGLETGAKDQKIDRSFALKWAEVLQEWSERYGKKISGWWMDGCYAWVDFNEEIAQIYAKALQHGNPQTLIAFNPGVKYPIIRATRSENYTAGEINDPFNEIPTARFLKGAQWHALTFMGKSWGDGGTRFSDAQWAQWVQAVTAHGGVVTLDMAPNFDSALRPVGTYSPTQQAQFQAISAALKK